MTHLLRPDHVHATALKVLVVFIGHALDQTLRLGKVYVDSLVVGDRVAHFAKTPLPPFSQIFRPVHIILVYLGLRRIRIYFFSDPILTYNQCFGSGSGIFLGHGSGGVKKRA